jgi:hypothetical protein
VNPSIGRIVIYQPTPEEQGQSSSTEGFPAIITRVWSAACVNLQVLRDSDTPIAVTSVSLSAGAALDVVGHAARTWRWPERV